MTPPVSPAARRTAAKVSAAFEDDQQLAIKLNDAHSRLLAANARLWSGLRPGGLEAIYGDHPEFEALQLEAAVDSDSAVLSDKDSLGAIQAVHWEIHDAHNDYQAAAEDRRRLAGGIGELLAKLVDELRATGWTEDEARNVNVHAVAQGLDITSSGS